MIFVECTFLNPENMSGNSTLSKQFTDPTEFKKWYNLTKADPCVIINIMTFNPQEQAGRKINNDFSLLRLNKNNPL